MAYEIPVLSPVDLAGAPREPIVASAPEQPESAERIEGFTLEDCAIVLAHQEFYSEAGPAAVERQLGAPSFQKAYLAWMLRLLQRAPSAEALADARTFGSTYQSVSDELKRSQRRLEEVAPLFRPIPQAAVIEAEPIVATPRPEPPPEPSPQSSVGLVLSLLDGAELAAQLFLAPQHSESVYQRFGLADPGLRHWVLTEFNQRLQDPSAYQQWQQLYYGAVARASRGT